MRAWLVQALLRCHCVTEVVRMPTNAKESYTYAALVCHSHWLLIIALGRPHGKSQQFMLGCVDTIKAENRLYKIYRIRHSTYSSLVYSIFHRYSACTAPRSTYHLGCNVDVVPSCGYSSIPFLLPNARRRCLETVILFPMILISDFFIPRAFLVPRIG